MFEMTLAEKYSREWHEPVFMSIGRFSDYDFCSQSRKYSVEVKCDNSAARTGNFAIEYWNPSLDEASGVISTKATLWLQCVDYDGQVICYEFETNTLRRCVIEMGLVKSIENAIFKIIPIEQLRKFTKREFRLARAVSSMASVDT